ncbi:AAA family ATPase [Oceanimonas sp. CHS3-5]|uniref:AAA family ATPase n=1 Tax=Oceanimonas sp. CHS3-5 TaxID=3068186 RepID=UPI00273F6ED5|nr:AAA family ATPase [Oceanimonas sp. CHS3-5]MDP5293552.1 AAA family ATPase [Oceanimonas sp. CHS3-5]
MRITKLSLTNFRSFKATQTLEFAPLTLLFGPNSVGKSSVLMSLFYLQEILQEGHCDPIRLEALGDKHIGGFKNLVNGRDLSKRIVIKVGYDKKGFFGSSYSQVSEIVERELGFTVDSRRLMQI